MIDDRLTLKNNGYIKKERIGQGGFSTVFKVYHEDKETYFACKQVSYDSKNVSAKNVENEKMTNENCSHPNLVKFIESFTDQCYIYFIFEYIDIDLASLIINMSNYKLSHSTINYIAHSIIKGLNYLHSNNYIHRDMKLENIFLDHENGVRIGDFGLTRKIKTFKSKRNEMNKALRGNAFSADNFTDVDSPYSIQGFTRSYKSPELICSSRVYDEKIDIFSLGIMIIELFAHQRLFHVNTDFEQLSNYIWLIGHPLRNNKEMYYIDEITYFNFDDAPGIDLSQTFGVPLYCADLIRKMIDWNPDNRPSLRDIIESKVFENYNEFNTNLNIQRFSKDSNIGLNDLLQYQQDTEDFDWL